MNFIYNSLMSYFMLALCVVMVSSEGAPSETNDADEFEPVIIDNANFVEYQDFSQVDSNVFRHVSGVSIELSNLTQIPGKFLGELPHLVELTLKNNQIRNFGIRSLDFYFATKLQKLIIKNQKIGPLLNDSFIRMRNLTYLALICTLPDRIEKNAFNGLAMLEELNLSGNNLSMIHKELLQPLKKLRILILNNNKFEKFSYIPALSNLEKIYLEDNPIRNTASVNRTTLRKMAPKLRSVKFCTKISISCQVIENIC